MQLIKRNLLIFFRDKAAVFFSLFSVLIILGLYMLFLGSIMEEGLQEGLGFESDKISVVIASLTLAGMVAVTSVTSCLGALGVSISDKERAGKDFRTSPASRKRILAGYIFSSGIIGLIMTVAALVICIVYLSVKGAAFPSPADCALLLMTSVLSVLCGNSIVFFVTIFIKSQNAYTSISTIIGTLIGFLMGIYIPIGTFPVPVQWVIKLFPMTHAAGMFKQILADGELAELFSAAPPETLEGFREMYGVVFTYGGYTSGFGFSAIVLAATTILFYTLSLVIMRLRHD